MAASTPHLTLFIIFFLCVVLPHHEQVQQVQADISTSTPLVSSSATATATATAPTPPPPPPSPSPSPSPPPPAPFTFPPTPAAPLNCTSACLFRCSKAGRQNVCMRACSTCCSRCNCVPPGTSGNHLLCGPCYAQTTHNGRPKCP